MANKASPPRKPSRRPQRFQVNPLSVLSPDLNAAVDSTPQRYSTDDTAEVPADQNIELLSLKIIEPDPWNPRHILPQAIRQKFISKKTGPEATIKAWEKASNSDKDIAKQIQQFRIMGESLLKQGQVNPINVAKHFREDGTFVWRIESGERRFWAKWLLVVDGITKDRTIHAVLRDKLDPARQAVENLQTESLSAIGEARQIARLFLAELGLTPEHVIAQDIPPGGDEYFRIALRPTSELLLGRKRLPRGYWPKLEKIVGNKRQHLERKLQLLKLPGTLLSTADLHRLTERQLREIISRPEKEWESLILHTIKYKITGPELASISGLSDPDIGLKIILKNRSDKTNPGDIIKEKDTEPLSKENTIAIEKSVQKRVISLARYFSSNKLDKKIDLDQLADNIIQSGNHQMVLDSLAQIETLISRLKSKVAILDQKDRQ